MKASSRNSLPSAPTFAVWKTDHMKQQRRMPLLLFILHRFYIKGILFLS